MAAWSARFNENSWKCLNNTKNYLYGIGKSLEISQSDKSDDP